MDRSPAVQGALAVVIALLLVAGLVATQTVEPAGHDEVRTAAGPGATTTVVPAGVPTTGTGGVSPSPTGAPGQGQGSTATTVRTPATTAPPAAKNPGPSAPPKLGLYTYDTDRNGTKSTTDLRVDRDPEPAPGEQRFTFALREASNGNTITQYDAWRADGVYLRKSTYPNPAGGEPSVCDWTPDVLERKEPVRAGQEWSIDSSCPLTFGPAAGTIHLVGKIRVEGARRITVAGQAVDTWLLVQTLHSTFDFTYNGQPIHGESDQTNQQYYAPPQGMTVKTVEDSTETDPNGKKATSHVERVLEALQPKP